MKNRIRIFYQRTSDFKYCINVNQILQSTVFSCMHMQHLFLFLNTSFSSCMWKSFLYFFNFDSYWSCNIKIWRKKIVNEISGFEKIKKSFFFFTKSKLLLSINNQKINLTKWSQFILVAILTLDLRHQIVETQSGYRANKIQKLLFLQGSEQRNERNLWGIKNRVAKILRFSDTLKNRVASMSIIKALCVLLADWYIYHSE